jgi:hypothetical protein
MDGNAPRGINAQTNLVAANIYDGDFHIIADHNRFILLSA